MRRKKLDPTPERIKRANMRRRADRLRQLMNANFNDNDYWSLTLTYRQGEEPETIRGVRDDAADFVKRLRKCAKLFGVEPRYIYVIGAGIHRRHVHITVNSLPDMAILTGCWINRLFFRHTIRRHELLRKDHRSRKHYRGIQVLLMEDRETGGDEEEEAGSHSGEDKESQHEEEGRQTPPAHERQFQRQRLLVSDPDL